MCPMGAEGRRLVPLLHQGKEEQRGPDCCGGGGQNMNRKPRGDDGSGLKDLCCIVPERSGRGTIAEIYVKSRAEGEEGGCGKDGGMRWF